VLRKVCREREREIERARFLERDMKRERKREREEHIKETREREVRDLFAKVTEYAAQVRVLVEEGCHWSALVG
jgi:adenylate kinase